MIPPLDHRGLLPQGTYSATLDEVANRFATNPLRQLRMVELRRLISAELAPLAQGLELFLGGSYLSDKDSPGDIDCTIAIPTSGIESHMDLVVLCSTCGGKKRIWQEYRVELYPTLLFPGHNNFCDFFRYVGEKTAALKNLHDKDKRGIIKVESWILG